MKEPVASVVTVCNVTPSNWISSEILELKPEPVTVTVEPGGPLVGDNVMVATAYAALDKAVEIKPISRIENKVKETYFLFNCHQRPCEV